MTRRPNQTRGASLIYATVSLVALSAFCALAVDVGRVRLVKAELSNAADAAARAAAAKLAATRSASEARAEAIKVAGYHTADGTEVVLEAEDVVFGRWNAQTQQLDPDDAFPDSIRITAQRTTARRNSVPTVFARLIGADAVDLRVGSVAKGTVGPPTGIIGLSGVSVHNNLLVASYNSSVTTDPTPGNSNSNAVMLSNDVITGHNNNTIRGDIVLGPGGRFSGVNRTGSTVSKSVFLPAPASPAWTPGINPSSVPLSLTVGRTTTTLPGGTYWLTSLTVHGTLSFTGPATLFLNGDADVNGTIRAHNGVPANLKIYQIGSRTFGNDKGNHFDVTADVEAPNSRFLAKNNLTFRGRMLFDTVDVRNNAEFYYDEALGVALGATTVATVE